MKYLVTLNGKDYEVEVDKEEAVLLSVADTPVVAVAAAPAAPAAESVQAPVAAQAPQPPPPPRAPAEGDPVTSPLPGTVLSVKVEAGAAVRQGDVLLVVEAMKMENDVIASRDGTVGAVYCKNGDTVQTGATLMTLV